MKLDEFFILRFLFSDYAKYSYEIPDSEASLLFDEIEDKGTVVNVKYHYWEYPYMEDSYKVEQEIEISMFKLMIFMYSEINQLKRP